MSRGIKNIPNVFKFLLLIVVLSPFVFFIANKNHRAIEKFEATGKVAAIEWNSRDHGMPVISIQQKNGMKKFKSNRITLNHDNIFVGDDFIKLKNSKECKINGKLIKCIN